MAAAGTRRVSQEEGYLEELLGVGGQLRLSQEAPALLFLGQREPCHRLCLANQ